MRFNRLPTLFPVLLLLLVVKPLFRPPRPFGDRPPPDHAARPATVLAAARAPDRPRYVWPVSPATVVRRFDPPPQPWRSGHRGVDLAAPPSTPVRATGPGVVAYAGRLAGRGVVSVVHPGGFRSTYEPIVPALRAGDRVGAGSPLGTLHPGHPDCPAPSCLHWGLRAGDRYLDPLMLLGHGRVRLLPLGGPSG